MAADVGTTLASWSATASSNQPDNSDAVGPNTLAENIRTLQSVVRDAVAGSGTIASATTTDLSTKTENYLAVSGTTTITGLGTVSAGIIKVLKFDGALTFTHNGTSLILPGAANITTAAGDIAIVRSEGSGNWRCLHYMKAGGVERMELITKVTPSAAANVDFLSSFTSSYNKYLVVFHGIKPATDDALCIRLAASGSADTGTSYSASIDPNASTSTTDTKCATSATFYGSGKGGSGDIFIDNTADATNLKTVRTDFVYQSTSAPAWGHLTRSFAYFPANAVTGVRLFWSGGANFSATGTVYLYGIRNT